MNKENVNRLYQLILEEDEMLMGSQWEEMYCNEYDTPKSILDNFINIYLATNFVDVDDDLEEISLADREEKIMALIRYFEKTIKDLKNELNCDDYCWIENLDVKVVEKWKIIILKKVVITKSKNI